MAGKIHLWMEDVTKARDQTILSAAIEIPKHVRKHLWYRLPSKYAYAATEKCDPFLLATLFTAMRHSTNLFLHGQVSARLLQNLEEFQAAWHCWRPDKYPRIQIQADVECQQHQTDNSNKAVAAFSGGLDSCFTVWRHHSNNCGRQRQNLQAAVMVHGFDIALGDTYAFQRAASNCKKMLKALSIQLITIATNFRELDNDWENSHGAAIASCLMLLGNGFSTGLIASSEPYNNLVLPWGTNPVTDGLMSSDTFQIIHDGAAFTRSQKVRSISRWPQALRYMRVCWEGGQKDRNCGKCEKCIRTILNFRVAGLKLPPCFDRDVTDEQISALRGLNRAQMALCKEILSDARAACICEQWVTALEKCIKRNQAAGSNNKSRWRQIAKTVGFRRHLQRLTTRVKK
ncbi:MAG TPA: hypothetical protein VMW23_08175 [Sedimentisphaerales bacterium]|nr:hypothetical protein [Sedimentisphaerales bacterium]